MPVSVMKKFVLPALLGLLFSSLQPSSSFAANPKAGAKCTKAGQTQTFKGVKYTCTKSGKKLTWRAGARPSTSSPTPTASPTPSPTPTPTAAPQVTPNDPIALRVNQLIDPGTGTTGVYLREVGGKAIADFRSDFVLDPASSIKTLIALYAFKQKASGSVTLQTQIPKVVPSSGCPTAQTNGTEDLETAIMKMMQLSDNDRTLELMLFFGVAPLNSFAKSLGLNSTGFRIVSEFPGFVIVGCGIRPIPAEPTVRSGNTTTLADMSKLWEQVNSLPSSDRAALLRLTAGREMFDTQGIDFTGIWPRLLQIVKEETPSTMSKASVTKFTDAMRSNSKGGSGSFCVRDCALARWWVSMFGLTTIPTCQGGTTVPKTFVWGYFVHGADSPSRVYEEKNPALTGFLRAGGEPMREQIRSALTDWQACTS